MHILAASSVFRVIKPKNSKHLKLLLPSVTANLSFSLNPNSRNTEKNMRNACDEDHLKDRSDFVIWHDILNNSITTHKQTNDNRTCDVEELVSFLQRHSDRIKAIIYCQKVWRNKQVKTAVEIGNFSDPVNKAFGVKT